MRIKLHFTDAQIDKLSSELGPSFTGPDFTDAQGVKFGTDYVHVTASDGTCYSYPHTSIVRVAQYP